MAPPCAVAGMLEGGDASPRSPLSQAPGTPADPSVFADGGGAPSLGTAGGRASAWYRRPPWPQRIPDWLAALRPSWPEASSPHPSQRLLRPHAPQGRGRHSHSRTRRAHRRAIDPVPSPSAGKRPPWPRGRTPPPSRARGIALRGQDRAGPAIYLRAASGVLAASARPATVPLPMRLSGPTGCCSRVFAPKRRERWCPLYRVLALISTSRARGGGPTPPRASEGPAGGLGGTHDGPSTRAQKGAGSPVHPRREKTTAPRVPAWSPTVVLTGRHSG